MLERATSSEPSATFHFMFLRSLARFCSSLSINFTHCRQEVYSERSRAKEAAPQRTVIHAQSNTVCDSIQEEKYGNIFWELTRNLFKRLRAMPLKESNI